jgi:Leucine-rich repeat (LRR) protein
MIKELIDFLLVTRFVHYRFLQTRVGYILLYSDRDWAILNQDFNGVVDHNNLIELINFYTYEKIALTDVYNIVPYLKYVVNSATKSLFLGEENLRKISFLKKLCLDNLEELHLWYNQLENIDCFKGLKLPKLTVLDISGFQGDARPLLQAEIPNLSFLRLGIDCEKSIREKCFKKYKRLKRISSSKDYAVTYYRTEIVTAEDLYASH